MHSWQIALALACLVALAAASRTHALVHEAPERDSPEAESKALVRGSSRSLFGEERLFNYKSFFSMLTNAMIVLFVPETRMDIRVFGDGSLTGICTRFKRNYALCHTVSYLRSLDLETSAESPLGARWMANTPTRVLYTGHTWLDISQTPKREIDKSYEFHFKQVLRHGIGVFELKPHRELDPNLANTKMPRFSDEFPVVLLSTADPPGDCYVFAYSLETKTDAWGHARMHVRELKHWRVKLTNCFENGICVLTFQPDEHSSKPGRICNVWTDVGAPVYCGPGTRSKLSYIVLQQSFTDRDHIVCDKSFDVLPIAPYYNHLMNIGIDPTD